ncbi:MAG: histidine phosphatase family protein [Firmicutes bacterium]|nr:histidine phosphatase family protein [Bacillota bacterium]
MIYYVRHGETFFNKQGNWSGYSDTILTGKGVKQAVDLGHKIKDVKFDLVFASPLLRTKQTCELILTARPADKRPPVIIDARIIEYYCGDYEGLEWMKHPDFDDDFFSERKLYDYSTVESFEAVEARVKSFLDELWEEHKGKDILVVAHGGVGRVFKAYFDGKPKSGFYRDTPEMMNCELIKFDFDKRVKK